MLRLPDFRYLVPRTVNEAVRIKSDHGPEAMYVAGGTDLYPNMKRRHQTPTVVIQVAHLRPLRGVRASKGRGLRVGAGETLTALERHRRLGRRYGALAHAAREVSTPILRNMGTFGGNLCLDTRCNYYNQNYEWRKAIDFCMKKDGSICWVAPSSPRCWAVNSSDTAPVVVALGAEIDLVGPDGERTIPAQALYNNDGIDYLGKRPDELLTAVWLPEPNGWAASYVKLRRRGSFDFPVLGVATWVKRDGAAPDAPVIDARVVLGAVASYPMPIPAAAEALIGRPLTDESIHDAAEAAWRPAKPMDNTDYHLAWRKEMVRVNVGRALRAVA